MPLVHQDFFWSHLHRIAFLSTFFLFFSYRPLYADTFERLSSHCALFFSPKNLSSFVKKSIRFWRIRTSKVRFTGSQNISLIYKVNKAVISLENVIIEDFFKITSFKRNWFPRELSWFWTIRSWYRPCAGSRTLKNISSRSAFHTFAFANLGMHHHFATFDNFACLHATFCSHLRQASHFETG